MSDQLFPPPMASECACAYAINRLRGLARDLAKADRIGHQTRAVKAREIREVLRGVDAALAVVQDGGFEDGPGW